MFLTRLIQLFLGYIKFKTSGAAPERFLNAATRAGARFFDMRRHGPELYASVRASKYPIAQEQAKKTGVTLTVLKNRGLPFLFLRHKKRWGFFTGLALFAAILVYFSGYVWTIEITGNDTVSQKEILYTLDDLGLSPGVRKSTFDLKELEQQALVKLPALSYLHVNLDGSVAKVVVGERSKRPDVVPDNMPCNIRATETGQIIKMEVYNGKSLLKVNDAVEKGELIVSGVIEEPETSVTRYVHASAAVIARTNRTLSVTVPFHSTELADTGRVVKRYSIRFLNLTIPFYHGVPKGDYRRLVYTNRLTVFGVELPVSFQTTAFCEVHESPVTRDKNAALQAARALLTEKEKTELSAAKIESKTYVQKTDAASLTLTGKYKCEEDISETQEVKIGETAS